MGHAAAQPDAIGSDGPLGHLPETGIYLAYPTNWCLQCEMMIRQGLLRRVFAEWQRLCQERDWKTQLATRDNEIRRMDREVRHGLICNAVCTL